MKKLIYGHGINDYDGTVSYYANGKKKNKPFYCAWMSMIMRCYSDNYHQRRPTYIGCSVCDSWLSLTAFKEWHDINFVEGCHLDKDIIQKGNKIYSPENCRYVSSQLNTLLTDRAASRGDYPQGVCFCARSKINPYHARVNINGKSIHIGIFPTAKQAFSAYANAKHKLIIDAARDQTDSAIRDGLISHAENLLDEADNK